MSKDEDDGDGFSRRGPSPGGDSEWSPLGGFDVGQSSGGAPGKRSLTQGIRAADPRAVLLAKLRTVRGQISGVRDRHLPGMNAAIDAPKPDMDAACGAAIDLGLALGTIDRELAEARELATVLHSDGARAMVEDLARKATDLHAESDPVLALAPPAAQAVPALAAFAAHLFLGGLGANDATETEQRRQWVARLDAHKVRPQAGGAVIDASSRFRGKPGRAAATARPDRAAATIDKPAEYEETRATIDDSPETTLAVAAPRPRDLGRADRSATTIDKPAEYEDTRATIEETPRHEAVERETARSDRAAATIDKPAEYEETRATIDGSARTTDRVVAKQARQPDRPRPDRAAATIDKPAEYEDTRATIDHSPELESADTRPPKESGRPDRAAATIDKPPEWEETRATVDDSPDDDEDPDPDKPGGGRKKRRGATEVAVQRKQTADAVDDNHVQITAAAGVANANAPLPHHDAIQQSFGRHDVSQVRAQVGGEGAAAASAIGAEAYAVGDRAAFAAFPDLHTAAHEAAHTVQQRAGVQLLGGVGATGDRYEQHADRVADAVVAGRSAEPLLDEMAPGKTAASASAGVQRLEAKEQRVGPATEFLHSNTHELQISIARHLANLDWPAPEARLPWRDQEGFRTALVSRLRSDVLENLTALARLCHPGDPRAVIDEMRGGPKAPLTWMPSIGLAIAQLLEASIRASLRRLGPRWLAAAEQENDSDVQYGWLVTSAPIDEVVGRAMTSGQVFDVQAAPDGATPTKALAGTRHVEIKWQGARSPNLWNWVKAIEPADATTEEIAASLFGSRIADAKSQSKGSLRGLGRGSSLAYRITAAPPLFGLPPELARQFSEAQEHAPHEHSEELDRAPADVMAAAWSPATAELAMAQAPAAPSTGDDPAGAAPQASPESRAIVEQTSGNLVQLNYLVRVLAPWGLTGQIAPAILFLIGKQGAVASMSEEDRAVWQRVFAGQRDNLARIGGAVVQVLDQASSLHIDDPSSPEAATLQRILAGYARAASISHLVATSQGLIEQAATQQSQLALIAVQSSARRMDASVDYDRAVSGGGEVDDPETRIGRVAARQMDPTAPDPARARSEQQRANRRDAAAYDDKLQDQGIGLQSRLLAGAAVDAAELEDFQLQADARALEHRAHAASVQIVSLLHAAHEAAQGEGGSIASRAAQNLDRSAVTRGIAPLLTLLLSSDFPKVEPRCRQMNKDLQDAVKYLGTARQNYAEKRIDADGYRQAIAKVQEKFQAIAGDEEFAKFLKDGASQIKWQVFRGASIEMAMLVGISIVGGGLAGWAAEGVGAMMTTTAGVESVAELSAGARMVMGGTQMVADAAINAAGQTAIQGTSFGDGFLENLMISAGTSVILGDMARAVDGVAKADAEGAAMWGKAKRGKAWKAGAWVLNETLAITGHTVMGAALGYVSARLVTGQSHPPPATLQEWLMQGASITVGRYVHKGLEARSRAFKEFNHGYEPARDLATRTRKLQEKAKQLEGGADKHEKALEVLGEHHELLAAERQMLEKLTDRGPDGDAAREQAGISMNEADAMSTDADARLQDAQAPGLAALSMHLAGLEELVQGAVWRGTAGEIDAAIAHVEGSGRQVTSVRDEATGTRWVTIDGRTMEMVERAPAHETNAGDAAHARDRHGSRVAETPANEMSGVTPEEQQSVAKRDEAGSAEHMVDVLANAKALPEQHAHEQGSVPVEMVLRALGETEKLTPEQRSQQIAFLEQWIAEITGGGKRDVTVHDLRPEQTAARTQDGEVQSPEQVAVASRDGAEQVGVLNELLAAKRAARDAWRAEGKQSSAYRRAIRRVDEATERYRKLIPMRKPDQARYGAGVDPAKEFFVKYKMIEQHGLTTAEIAKSRNSADQLGMQELRYSPDHKGPDAIDRIRDDARDLIWDQPDDVDVNLTFATTKNRLNDESPAKNEQGLSRDFVDQWYTDPVLQRSFGGFESAGQESRDKPPAAQWESAAARAYKNAEVVARHLDAQLAEPGAVDGLAERVSRLQAVSVEEAHALVERYRMGGYEQALADVDAAAEKSRSHDTTLRDGRAALAARFVSQGMSPADAQAHVDAMMPWKPEIPGFDSDGGAMALRFGGLDVEALAADTRMLAEALRVWSAETGTQHGDVHILGMTVHAGEQLTNPNVDPFVLLDQVDQALAMGTDRIGHGLILGVDADVLINKGLLPPNRADEFRARQAELVDRVRRGGVVIETNLSSNVEISNLTAGEHPAGLFADEGLRVTVNTDDETVLATDMQRELERVARSPGVERTDLAAMILEGYRSRMGNRELNNRARVKATLRDALTAGLSGSDAAAFADNLARRFGVVPRASADETLVIILDAVLGVE